MAPIQQARHTYDTGGRISIDRSLKRSLEYNLKTSPLALTRKQERHVKVNRFPRQVFISGSCDASSSTWLAVFCSVLVQMRPIMSASDSLVIHLEIIRCIALVSLQSTPPSKLRERIIVACSILHAYYGKEFKLVRERSEVNVLANCLHKGAIVPAASFTLSSRSHLPITSS
ncbi:hypothetical protein J6590_033320 [Homalodisca vitripennis]|nr:hypothetical protein J6590_033320 [Homalodisca vitripennis]